MSPARLLAWFGDARDRFTATLAQAENNETANTGVSDVTGLLSDEATNSAVAGAAPASALAALAAVEVKGRAPKTGYTRDQFGPAWADTDHNGCDTRDDMLARDLTGDTFKPGIHNCFVLTGTQANEKSGPLETSVRGVFAIGDVRAGSTKRVAAAVGDGAQAVAALHAYLAETEQTPVEILPTGTA